MKTHIKSIVVLSVICLAASLLLAFTNHFTAPVIKESNEQKVKQACYEVIYNADDFIQFEVSDEIKEKVPNVTAIFKETTEKGYVFEITTHGYSNGFVIVCGITQDGKIENITVTSSNETETIGGQVKKDSYISKYRGKGSISEIDSWLISRATMTSTAFKNAVSDAFTAFDIIKNGGPAK